MLRDFKRLLKSHGSLITEQGKIIKVLITFVPSCLLVKVVQNFDLYAAFLGLILHVCVLD